MIIGKSGDCKQPIYIEYDTHTIYYHIHHARIHTNKPANAQKHAHSQRNYLGSNSPARPIVYVLSADRQ